MVLVRNIMSGDVKWVSEDDLVTKVQSIMRNTGFRALPVCRDDGQIVGIISRESALTVTSRRSNIEVRGLMNTNVASCKPTDDILMAGRKMISARVKQLPVVDESNRVIGMISSLDILSAIVKQNYKPRKKLVKDIMSRKVVFCHENDELSKVWNTMLESGYGGLPVINDHDVVVGIITRTDLLKRRSALISRESGKTKRIKVSRLMTRNVKTVNPESDIEEAANLMVSIRVIRLPVVDANKKLVGIIDTEDVLRAYI